MRFVKFYHRYEKDDGLVLQDMEAVIAAGSYLMFYYPKTGELLQLNEKIDAYPGTVSIHMNEYVARLGFLRGCRLALKNFLGINHSNKKTYEVILPEPEDGSFESFFEYSELPDKDLRPPVVIGGEYEV